MIQNEKERARKRREIENRLQKRRKIVRESMRCEAPELCEPCYQAFKIAAVEIHEFRQALLRSWIESKTNEKAGK